MPDSRQKYHITIGYQNGQSVQAITFMSRDALRTALASEPDEFGLVHIDCTLRDIKDNCMWSLGIASGDGCGCGTNF